VFQSLFVTRLYRARLGARLVREIEPATLSIATGDRAGQRWSKAHGYAGYTSLPRWTT
jgi:hypothetical protein